MSSARKVIKYLAIAFAISLIVGIFTGIYQAVGIIGTSLTSSKSGHGLNINEYKDNAKILSVDIGYSKLKIVEGDSLKVESDNKYIETRQDHNKLSVTEKKHNSFDKDDKEVIIYIPKDITFEKVYISNGAGTINIDNITAQELELEIGAGTIDIEKITVLNKTDIDGGTGEVMINNATLNNLDLDVGVGKFTLNAIIKGESEIDSGVGELNINLLDSKDNYRLYTETGIGSITIDGNSVKGESTYGNGQNKIDIDGGVGSINITFKEE